MTFRLLVGGVDVTGRCRSARLREGRKPSAAHDPPAQAEAVVEVDSTDPSAAEQIGAQAFVFGHGHSLFSGAVVDAADQRPDGGRITLRTLSLLANDAALSQGDSHLTEGRVRSEVVSGGFAHNLANPQSITVGDRIWIGEEASDKLAGFARSGERGRDPDSDIDLVSTIDFALDQPALRISRLNGRDADGNRLTGSRLRIEWDIAAPPAPTLTIVTAPRTVSIDPGPLPTNITQWDWRFRDQGGAWSAEQNVTGATTTHTFEASHRSIEVQTRWMGGAEEGPWGPGTTIAVNQTGIPAAPTLAFHRRPRTVRITRPLRPAGVRAWRWRYGEAPNAQHDGYVAPYVVAPPPEGSTPSDITADSVDVVFGSPPGAARPLGSFGTVAVAVAWRLDDNTLTGYGPTTTLTLGWPANASLTIGAATTYRAVPTIGSYLVTPRSDWPPAPHYQAVVTVGPLPDGVTSYDIRWQRLTHWTGNFSNSGFNGERRWVTATGIGAPTFTIQLGWRYPANNQQAVFNFLSPRDAQVETRWRSDGGEVGPWGGAATAAWALPGWQDPP